MKQLLKYLIWTAKRYWQSLDWVTKTILIGGFLVIICLIYGLSYLAMFVGFIILLELFQPIFMGSFWEDYHKWKKEQEENEE